MDFVNICVDVVNVCVDFVNICVGATSICVDDVNVGKTSAICRVPERMHETALIQDNISNAS